MNKAIEDILKQYPYICDDIQKAQAELNGYIVLQIEARNTLKGQIIDEMPHGTGISDQTYNAVEKLIDDYQVKIDECVQEINGLLDLKKWMDKAFAALTEDERRILYLRYDERWQTWKIMKRLGIMKRDTFYKLLDSAKEKINKIMFT
jgi:DNA-directed RNA polymerase specialized sigma subunit